MFRPDASATADVGSRSSWWSHSAGRRCVHTGPTPGCPGSWFAVQVAPDQCPWVRLIMCRTASYETIYSAQVSTTATVQTQLRTLYFVMDPQALSGGGYCVFTISLRFYDVPTPVPT